MGCTQSSEAAAPAAAATAAAAASTTAAPAAAAGTTPTAPTRSTGGGGSAEPENVATTRPTPTTAQNEEKKKVVKQCLVVGNVVEFWGADATKDSYKVLKRIGEDSISKLYLVQRTSDDATPAATTTTSEQQQADVYALQEIDTDLVHPAFWGKIRDEIKLMKIMDHPNILKALQFYEDTSTKKMNIIVEYCGGRDLGSHAPYSEPRAKEIVAKIIEAVNYLHLHGIMHRDLKLENIMFENETEHAEPKLIDFGLAQKYVKSQNFQEDVGALYSTSPEAIRGNYDKQTDMWSIGVITYWLLSGDAPFEGTTRKEIEANVVQGRFTLSGPKWDDISNNAKSFIQNLLTIEPTSRYSANQALKSPWLDDITTQAADVGTLSLLQTMAGKHANAEEKAEFQKLVLQTIASRSSSQEEILKLRQVFQSLDANHDGALALSELRTGLKTAQFMNADDIDKVEEWFSNSHPDGNGEINYTEFIAALLESQCALHHDKVVEAFAALDRDNKGYVARGELKETLGVSIQSEYVEQLLQEADTDGDGKITLEEFQIAMRRKTTQNKFTLKKQQQLPNNSNEG